MNLLIKYGQLSKKKTHERWNTDVLTSDHLTQYFIL